MAYESDGGSYIEFAQTIRKLSINPKYDLDQLYRRMIFNLMIDNTDDHVKNHGMLHVRQGQYKLTPAFDMVMQFTNLGYQELAITPGNHSSILQSTLNAAPHFGLNTNEASHIISKIQTTVHQQMVGIADHFGASQSLQTRIHQCLNRQREIIHS